MGNKPLESMDREKAFIPGDQIQFIDHIVLPVYRMLRDLDTSTEVVHRAVVKNKNYWVAMKNILEERGVRRGKMDVMEIFQVTKSPSFISDCNKMSGS